MTWCFAEFTLTDILADPLTRSVMAADGVDPERLARSLVAIADHRRDDRSTPRGEPSGAHMLDALSMHG